MSYRAIRNGTAFAAMATVLAGCPCSTTATFNVSRLPEDKTGLPTILVCPGEEIAFVWETRNAVEAVIDNDVGQVSPVESGRKPWVAPELLTNFQFTAVGDQCNAMVPATVHTIRDGEEYTVNMAGEKDVFVWRGLVNAAFASPSIEVTHVRLTSEAAASWPRWNMQRDDVLGVSAGSSSAVVEAQNVRVAPFPLIGAYQLAPAGSSSNTIATGNPMGVVMTLRCRRQ